VQKEIHFADSEFAGRVKAPLIATVALPILASLDFCMRSIGLVVRCLTLQASSLQLYYLASVVCSVIAIPFILLSHLSDTGGCFPDVDFITGNKHALHAQLDFILQSMYEDPVKNASYVDKLLNQAILSDEEQKQWMSRSERALYLLSRTPEGRNKFAPYFPNYDLSFTRRCKILLEAKETSEEEFKIKKERLSKLVKHQETPPLLSDMIQIAIREHDEAMVQILVDPASAFANELESEDTSSFSRKHLRASPAFIIAAVKAAEETSEASQNMIRLLVSQGANIHEKDQNGVSAWDLAVEKGKKTQQSLTGETSAEPDLDLTDLSEAPRESDPQVFLQTYDALFESSKLAGRPWEAFGLPTFFTQKDLNSKYRQLSLKLHPDKHPNDREHADTLFKKLDELKTLCMEPKPLDLDERELDFSSEDHPDRAKAF